MRNRTTSRAVLVAVLGLALGMPGMAAAFPGGGPGGHGTCPAKAFFYSFFNITPDQQDELEALRDTTFEAVKPLMKESGELSDQLSETLLAESIDTVEAARLIDETVALKSQIAAVMANAKVEAAQVLTPAQRADIQEVIQDVSAFIEYIQSYPELDNLKEKYDERIKQAFADIRPDSTSDELNITDEQKAALHELKDATRESIQPLAEQMKAAGKELTDTLLADSIDTEKASNQISAMIELQAQIMAVELNARVTAALIFTPEQRQIMLEKKQEREQMHELFHNRFPRTRDDEQ